MKNIIYSAVLAVLFFSSAVMAVEEKIRILGVTISGDKFESQAFSGLAP